MTRINYAADVNEALAGGLRLLTGSGVLKEETRNGPVYSATGPVITETTNPLNRVLFSPKRRANPVFHLMESFWMLAGRNDLPWLAQFNRMMATYSDDGGATQPGAYGYRWRQFFGYDQLDYIVFELRERPNSRRAVLTMWNGGGDRDNSVLVGTGDLINAITGTADVPCNTQCFFRVRNEEAGPVLDMGVTCRSNDALWGAHGANAVHFSVLMEYIAAKLNVGVGRMTQFSWNYHIYPGALKCDMGELAMDCVKHNYYLREGVQPTPLFTPENVALFDTELPYFMEYASPDRKFPPPRDPALSHPAFVGLGVPMVRAWSFHKKVDYHAALAVARHDIVEGDWQRATTEWMQQARDIHDAREA